MTPTEPIKSIGGSMKESTKKLLTLIALKGGDAGVLARAVLELEASL